MKNPYSKLKKFSNSSSERGYLIGTSASRQGVLDSNLIAAPKSCEVYPGLGILRLADCCPSISLKKCLDNSKKILSAI